MTAPINNLAGTSAPYRHDGVPMVKFRLVFPVRGRWLIKRLYVNINDLPLRPAGKRSPLW